MGVIEGPGFDSGNGYSVTEPPSDSPSTSSPASTTSPDRYTPPSSPSAPETSSQESSSNPAPAQSHDTNSSTDRGEDRRDNHRSDRGRDRKKTDDSSSGPVHPTSTYSAWTPLSYQPEGYDVARDRDERPIDDLAAEREAVEGELRRTNQGGRPELPPEVRAEVAHLEQQLGEIQQGIESRTDDMRQVETKIDELESEGASVDEVRDFVYSTDLLKDTTTTAPETGEVFVNTPERDQVYGRYLAEEVGRATEEGSWESVDKVASELESRKGSEKLTTAFFNELGVDDTARLTERVVNAHADPIGARSQVADVVQRFTNALSTASHGRDLAFSGGDLIRADIDAVYLLRGGSFEAGFVADAANAAIDDLAVPLPGRGGVRDMVTASTLRGQDPRADLFDAVARSGPEAARLVLEHIASYDTSAAALNGPLPEATYERLQELAAVAGAPTPAATERSLPSTSSLGSWQIQSGETTTWSGRIDLPAGGYIEIEKSWAVDDTTVGNFSLLPGESGPESFVNVATKTTVRLGGADLVEVIQNAGDLVERSFSGMSERQLAELTSDVEQLAPKLKVGGSASASHQYSVVLPESQFNAVQSGGAPMPNFHQPDTLPPGSTLIVRNEAGTAFGGSVQQQLGRLALGAAAGSGSTVGTVTAMQRLEDGSIRFLSGDTEAVSDTLGLSAGIKIGADRTVSLAYDFSIGITRANRDTSVTFVDLDISTPAGQAAAQEFAQSGALPPGGESHIVNVGMIETHRTFKENDFSHTVEVTVLDRAHLSRTATDAWGTAVARSQTTYTATGSTHQLAASDGGLIAVTTRHFDPQHRLQGSEHHLLLDNAHVSSAEQIADAFGLDLQFTGAQDIQIAFDESDLARIQTAVERYATQLGSTLDDLRSPEGRSPVLHEERQMAIRILDAETPQDLVQAFVSPSKGPGVVAEFLLSTQIANVERAPSGEVINPHLSGDLHFVGNDR